MRLNPLTWLVLALSTMAAVLIVDDPRFSTLVAALALTLATAGTRSLATLLGALALTVPTGLSMLLIHAPHGSVPLAGPVTGDGLALAADLTLRFLALMSTLLAAMALIRVPDLVKAVQASPLGHRTAYILGASIQLLPQGRAVVAAVRDAQRLRGRRIGARAITRLAVPTITQLLSTGTRRGLALETAGLDLPGRRTVLRPVPHTATDKVITLLAPLTVAVIAWI